jgi:hypothetical protein
MTPLCSSEVFLVKLYVVPTSASKKAKRNLVTSVLDHQLRDGNSHGYWRCNDDATLTTAMDSARATAIEGATVMRQRGRHNGNVMAM